MILNGVTGITLVLGGIAAIASLAVLVFMFRINYAKLTIEYLRGDRDDAIVRADGFEADLTKEKELRARETTEYQTKILSHEAALSARDQEIHILRNVVTGKEQLDRIEKTLIDLYERKFSS